ncbi:MAG: hypothetical protein L3J21_09940 [Devosiaceae bacterium]|nr:hypothetical protein [Devosiaceae bacterium]
MEEEKKKFKGSFDKMMFYVASISIVTLLGVQVDQTSILVLGQSKNNRELSFMSAQLSNVMTNQKTLQASVEAIRGQVVNVTIKQKEDCFRGNFYWSKTQLKC